MSDTTDAIQIKKNQEIILKQLVNEQCPDKRALLANQAYDLQQVLNTRGKKLSRKDIIMFEAQEQRIENMRKKKEKRKIKKESLKIENAFKEKQLQKIKDGHSLSGLNKINYTEVLVATPGSGKKR